MVAPYSCRFQLLCLQLAPVDCTLTSGRHSAAALQPRVPAHPPPLIIAAPSNPTSSHLPSGERGEATVLDVGCAVGGASFHLARAFPHVLGLDFSSHFVAAANVCFLGGGGEGERGRRRK